MIKVANWCWDRFAIFNKDSSEEGKSELNQLWLRLNRALDGELTPDETRYKGSYYDSESKCLKESEDCHVANDWYGNIFVVHGEKPDTIEGCRGSIQDLRFEDTGAGEAIFIDAETAWSPMDDKIAEMLDKYYEHLGFVFTAEEPGNCIYVNTDRDGDFFVERWKLDGEILGDYISDYIDCYFENESQVEDALDIIDEKVKEKYPEYKGSKDPVLSNGARIDKILEFCKEHGDEDAWMYLYEFEYE